MAHHVYWRACLLFARGGVVSLGFLDGLPILPDFVGTIGGTILTPSDSVIVAAVGSLVLHGFN